MVDKKIEKDREVANIKQMQALTQQAQAFTINTLISAGFNVDDVIEAVTANDLRQLKDSKH